jgi:hypothetical protein
MASFCDRLWQLYKDAYTATEQQTLKKLYEDSCSFRWGERDFMEDDDD